MPPGGRFSRSNPPGTLYPTGTSTAAGYLSRVESCDPVLLRSNRDALAIELDKLRAAEAGLREAHRRELRELRGRLRHQDAEIGNLRAALRQRDGEITSLRRAARAARRPQVIRIVLPEPAAPAGAPATVPAYDNAVTAGPLIPPELLIPAGCGVTGDRGSLPGLATAADDDGRFAFSRLLLGEPPELSIPAGPPRLAGASGLAGLDGGGLDGLLCEGIASLDATPGYDGARPWASSPLDLALTLARPW
jgi:hypothetical protein